MVRAVVWSAVREIRRASRPSLGVDNPLPRFPPKGESLAEGRGSVRAPRSLRDLAGPFGHSRTPAGKAAGTRRCAGGKGKIKREGNARHARCGDHALAPRCAAVHSRCVNHRLVPTFAPWVSACPATITGAPPITREFLRRGNRDGGSRTTARDT